MSRDAVVYLIICHQSAEYIRHLHRLLYSPADIILIHYDQKSPPDLAETSRRLSSTFSNTLTLNSAFTSWGGYSLTSVVFRGIELARRLSVEWSHLVLLSEQHLPLYPADEIFIRLVPGESLIPSSKVSEMHEAAVADIRHRFGMSYRELAGVGPFVQSLPSVPSDLFGLLYHGSQWCILARDACERIHLAQSSCSDFLRIFERSLISDEMAIPTILRGTSLGAGLRIRSENASFIAYPHLNGGQTDLVFSEANFFTAMSQNYLFIRKRPLHLYQSVSIFLESRCSLTEGHLTEALGALPEAPAPSLLAESLSAIEDRITNQLTFVKSIYPDITVERLKSIEFSNVPKVYYNIYRPSWSDNNIFVNLLSEDLSTFKISIFWRGGYDQLLEPILVPGFAATVSKARIHGIAFCREIFSLAGQKTGFQEPVNEADWQELGRSLGHYMDDASAFLSALKGTA